MYSILEALSLLLPVVPSIIQPVSTFLASISNPFETWLSSTNNKSWTTLYRLLPYIVNEIRTKWNWTSLFGFLSCDNIKVRYYACQVICILLNKTENERNQMEVMLQVDPTSCYQSRSLMELMKEEQDFQHYLLEKRRILLHTVVEDSPDSMEIEEKNSDDSQNYVEICGYILPCKSTDSSVSSYDDFVMTPTSKDNLTKLCLQMQKPAPILLQGSSGSGKTHLFQELARLTHNTDYVQLFLDDQMDSKSLIGNYVCTDKPGEFIFQPGTLTQCITTGKWIIIEDIDKIPFDIVTTLLPIIEKGELSIPSRGVTLKIHKNFRLFGTSSHDCSASNSPINSFLCNHWSIVNVGDLTLSDLQTVIQSRYPQLIPIIQEKVIVTYQVLAIPSKASAEEVDEVLTLLQNESDLAITVTANDLLLMRNELLRFGKPVTCRDLIKLCQRLSAHSLLTSITTNTLSEQSRKLILDEALDVFAGSLPEGHGQKVVCHIIASIWNLSATAVDGYLQTAPSFSLENGKFEIGRVQMDLAKESYHNHRFYKTKQSLRLMQQMCVCIKNEEPMLLVGETGCGKTTVIQYIAQCIGQELVVMNMNEQTQCSDLIGGFKPVDLRQLAIPVFNRCCDLFNSLFMDNKHPTFKPGLKDALDSGDYKKLVARLKNFSSFASGKIQKALEQSKQAGKPIAKYEKWSQVIQEFYSQVIHFEKKVQQVEDSFAFSFIPGALVEAIEKGKWVLLDELNLAPGEVLQRLSGLLESVQSSLILSERGDVTPIKRHPNFRIFAAMNPATDVGKKSLAPAVRNRFSEFYVNELTDKSDLELIVRSSLELASSNDLAVTPRIVDFYLEARRKSENTLVDGANKPPRYSLRTLCRALDFVNNAGKMKLTFRAALFEGLSMAFLTMLDIPSQAIMRKLITEIVFYGQDLNSVYPSRNPGGSNSFKDDYVLVNRYWIRKGESPCIDLSQSIDGKPPRFILTDSVKTRLDDLCRAILMEKCPVLLQGPTSSGKTSMIMYLASLTGHKCVRINNHEYTDLQDYTGIYISSPTGQLVFHEGLLVEALRKGYWVILDELNLAPSEVLEALNRLLDDNRELYIPETNTIVKPHPNFMLFATQNPPGKYGGRKVLSRAFRNRFLEMHVEDLPPEEMQIIIQKRSGVCERFAKEMITVMQKLQLERQSSNVFAGKDGFITPRDLLRWGNRCPASSEELAYHGYMLLAERLRREDEREKVKAVIEEVCKVKINLSEFYLKDEIIDRMMDPSASLFNKQVTERPTQLWNMKTLQLLQQQIQEEYANSESTVPSGLKSIAIVGTLQKLFKLIGLCLHYNEPVLLVGGTGCGKTTAVQLVAQALHQHLVILNCHAHTETSDIIGGQRPSRTHESDNILFKQKVIQYLSNVSDYPLPDVFASDSHPSFQEVCDVIARESPGYVMNWIHPFLDHRESSANEEEKDLIHEIKLLYGKYQTLFTWQDGPLLSTMKKGDIFLLDEISLAEDAVLERMNSILETERQITVPEKGGDCIEVYVADPKFRILATMNPGGDFGKKELSAALRNRFTEIWVSALNGLDDLKEIMKDRIRMKERGTHQFPALSTEVHEEMVKTLLPYVDLILSFIDFYNTLLNMNTLSSQNRTEATSRDILSIIDFMKLGVTHLQMSPAIAFTEALHMILFDGLGIGTNMSSTMSGEYKQKCFDKVIDLLPIELRGDVLSFYSSSSSLACNEQAFGINPYFIPIRDTSSSQKQLTDYHFNAPTTSNNLKRVLRALQLHKPILLEGSPGVGKTSLIMAIAQVIGQKIVRINLSEQTDMADLLGSDLPVPLSQQSQDESGNSIQFQWSDGVLLSGIKQGAWILLDELNLASQQVLEGLNSCLDHRATIYIPEIDKEFHCPETFQIFACQNPIEEGGGRKGLPRSFINRFARVYVDALNEDDMRMISNQLVLSKVDEYYGKDNTLVNRESITAILNKMVHFIVELDSVQNLGRAKSVNSFEFNLRDVFRWCDLMFANQVVNEWNPTPFLEMLFLQRMRDRQQRSQTLQLYQRVFDTSFTPSLYPTFSITDHSIKIGSAVGHRINSSQTASQQPILRQSSHYLQSLLFAVQNKLPCLLVGESGSGKSYALHTLASLLNVRLYEYNMNTTTDATEILGCFEQVEVSRHYSRLLSELVEVLRDFLWRVLISNCETTQSVTDFSFKRLRVNSMGEQYGAVDDTASGLEAASGKRSREVTPRAGAMLATEGVSCLYGLIAYLEQQIMMLLNGEKDKVPEITEVISHCTTAMESLTSSVEEEYVDEMNSLLRPAREIIQSVIAIHNASKHVSFEWIDGSLIEAIIRGYWVVFDNVNFCNASVLDRLNSLLENNGFLLINECGLVDGKERIVYPHNDFRVFFVMNPSFGEISRAMRNRCVELFFTPVQLTNSLAIEDSASLFDELDILNESKINDFFLQLLLVQIYHDIHSLYSIHSMIKLNYRYLKRFASLVVDALERGVSIENAIHLGIHNVFDQPFMSSFYDSTELKAALLSYHSGRSFCDRVGGGLVSFPSFLSSLSGVCNQALSIQQMRELYLLNCVIQFANTSASKEMLEEWISLMSTSVPDLQKKGFTYLDFLVNHSHDNGYFFYIAVILVYLLSTRSKPNLKQIELCLKSSPVAISLLHTIVSIIHKSDCYQELKSIQKGIVQSVRNLQSSSAQSHIPLFSNNFDENMLCTLEELINQLPLFISTEDPLVQKIHKIVINQALLAKSPVFSSLLSQLNTAIQHMNAFLLYLPLMSFLSFYSSLCIERIRGTSVNAAFFQSASLLELSLLIHNDQIDAHQIHNPLVQPIVPLLTNLIEIITVMTQQSYAIQEIALYAQYVHCFIQLFYSRDYASIQEHANTEQFNMNLIAFFQIFHSFFIQYHASLHDVSPSEYENNYHSIVSSILQDLHIQSNITMDNKLWSLLGKTLMCLPSESFTLYMTVIGDLITKRFVYSSPIQLSTLSTDYSFPSLYLTSEEKQSFVDALSTLLWMSQDSCGVNEEGVVSFAQLKEVIEQTLKNGTERAAGTQDVVDTTFNGSVEIEDSKSSVVMINASAVTHYAKLLHDISLFTHSLKQQSAVLSNLLANQWSNHTLKESFNHFVDSVTIPPYQLVSLKQVLWLTEKNVSTTQSSLPYVFEFLRYYLDNYWSDFAYGCGMFDVNNELAKSEELRTLLKGSQMALIPSVSFNLQALLKPLLNCGMKSKNNRNRIEQLEVFRTIIDSLLKEMNSSSLSSDVSTTLISNEGRMIFSIIVQLLNEVLAECSLESLDVLSEEQILSIQASLSELIQKAVDVPSLRYETLCMQFIPTILRLLVLQSKTTSSFLHTVVVSSTWILIGLLTFYMILPASIIDPLFKDYINRILINNINANMNDMIFLLQYQANLMNGSIEQNDISISRDYYDLYKTVLARNQEHLSSMEMGEFHRDSSNSFDQLYSTLYSFGSSVLNINRVCHLHTSYITYLREAMVAHIFSVSDKDQELFTQLTTLLSSFYKEIESSQFIIGDFSFTYSTNSLELLEQEEVVFQSNLISFKESLQRSYSGYADVIHPVLCSISEIQQGIRYLATIGHSFNTQVNHSLMNESMNYQAFLPFAEYPFSVLESSPQSLYSSMIDLMNHSMVANSVSKSAIFQSLLTQLLLYNVTVLKRNPTDSSIPQFINNFTDMFNQQREEEAARRAEEEKTMEFRTRKVDIDNISSNEEAIEAAYKQQFPDYQLLFDEEAQAKAEAQAVNVESDLEAMRQRIEGDHGLLSKDWKISTGDVEYVCEVIQLLMNQSPKNNSVPAIRDQLVYLNSQVLNSFEMDLHSLVLTDYEKVTSLFQLLQVKMAKEVTTGLDLPSILHPSRLYSFHNHSNIPEVEYCVGILLPMRRRVFSLLQQYPTHVVLQYIIRLIDHILQLPITTPLTVLLSGVEVLSRRVHDWEISAAQHVSLGDCVKQMNGLIIRWRKLELESWGSFLEEEETKFAKKSMEYFCQFYSLLLPPTCNDPITLPNTLSELSTLATRLNIHSTDLWTLLAPKSTIAGLAKILSDVDDSDEMKQMKMGSILLQSACDSTHTLVDILDSYLRGSQLLEFTPRLHLLLLLSRFMKHQLNQAHSQNTLLEVNMNILYHTTRMYSVFVPAVTEYIAGIKGPIEKKLKDQVKLGKWDDQSFFSLRETVHKIHHQLFKLIYEYRQANNIKVNVVLDQYLNGELQSTEKEESDSATMAVDLIQFKDSVLPSFDLFPMVFANLISKQQSLTEGYQLTELAGLSHLSSLYTRVTKLFSSPSVAYLIGSSTPGVDMDDFAVTIITTALELKKETKYTIRKQKAFSSLLTHLKEQGVSSLKASVSPYQQQYDYVMRLSVPEMKHIITIMKSVSALTKKNQTSQGSFVTNWTKADQYYYKNYLLLNSLRMQISQQVTDQLTPSEVRRCIGFTENLMNSILEQREVLTSLSSSIQQLYCFFNYFSQISLRDEAAEIQVCSDMPTLSHDIEVLFTSMIEVVDEVLFCFQKLQGDIVIPEGIHALLSEVRTTLQVEIDTLIPAERNEAFSLFAILHTQQYIHSLTVLQSCLQRLLEETVSLSKGSILSERLTAAQQQWSHALERVNDYLVHLQKDSVVVSLQTCDSNQAEDLLVQHNKLVNRFLLILQNVKRHCDENEKKTAEGSTISYQESHKAFLSMWYTLSLGQLYQDMDSFVHSVLSSTQSTFLIGTFLLMSLVPMLEQVLKTSLDVLLRGVMLNKGMNKLEYVLLKLFKEILKKGFCLPPKKEEEKKKEEEGMEEGTGMGDGEGAEDVTDQIDNKDQLDGIRNEQQQETGEMEEEEEKEADDTGMDMEDDFEGEEKDVKKDEEEEEEEEEKDLDREMGDLEDDDQDVVDEKLWNDEEEEEGPDENEKIEEDQKQDNKRNTEEMTTKEDDQEKKQEEQPQEQPQEEPQEPQDLQEEEKEMINDLNEQEYEDNHFMNQEEEEEEELPEDMNIEEEGEEEEIQEDKENEIPEEEEEETQEAEEAESEEMNEDAESEEMEGLGKDDEEDINHENEEELDVNDPNQNMDEEKETKENEESLEKEEKTAPTEGIADEGGDDNVIDENAEQKQGDADNEEEKMEEEEEEEENQQNAPDEGSMQEGAKGEEEEKEEEEKEEDDVNPYKNPEKTMKKWQQEYQRLQMVPQKEEEESGSQEQAEEEEVKRENQPLSDEVKQEKSGEEVLAPSIQDVDFKPQTEEANRVEIEECEEEEEEDEGVDQAEERYEQEMKDVENTPFPEEEPVDEVEEKQKREAEASAFANDLFERVTKEGQSNESVSKDEVQGVLSQKDIQMETQKEEPVTVPFADEDSYLNMNVSDLIVSPTTDVNRLLTATNAWKEFVNQTTDLSNRFTEQLRLLMEPTKASKLTGDFKTGKRINMRKVIPFIASNYRKDKIWLRRSKPSQREYQIMLVIDDSESMKQNHTDQVTFKTLAMISNSLTQVMIVFMMLY